MRRSVIATALAAVTIMSLVSCHRGEKNAENLSEMPAVDTVMTDNAWAAIKPDQITSNPYSLFAKDWMALGVGTKKNFNSMTIAWGTMGQLWNKPVVIVFVSKDRYSKGLMDSNKYFTVTGFPQTSACKEALVYIGSHSQRDEPDKTANAGLTVEFTELGNPIFSEGNLAIECRKIYSDEFESDKVPAEIMESMYSGMGLHTMYIGEIVNVWEKK